MSTAVGLASSKKLRQLDVRASAGWLAKEKSIEMLRSEVPTRNIALSLLDIAYGREHATCTGLQSRDEAIITGSQPVFAGSGRSTCS